MTDQDQEQEQTTPAGQMTCATCGNPQAGSTCDAGCPDVPATSETQDTPGPT